MSLDFKHTVEIERPANEVFNYIADFENNPAWQGGMKSCHWTSNKLALGGTYVQEAQFMGRRIETHFRVTEFAAGRSVSIESTKSTFPIQVTRSVEPRGEGQCVVCAHIRGQPTGLLKLFSGMVKRSVAKDYRKLKAMLEGT